MTSGTSFLEPAYVLASTFVIFAHHSAIVAYEAMVTPGWSYVNQSDGLRWLDTVLLVYLLFSNFGTVLVVVKPYLTTMQKEDFFVQTRTKLLHNVAHDLVVNFLPAPVMKAVQERVVHTAPSDSVGDLLEDSEIVAWAYDPACVLQSDIVGFTALGSRVSPQELCRWGSTCHVPGMSAQGMPFPTSAFSQLPAFFSFFFFTVFCLSSAPYVRHSRHLPSLRCLNMCRQ